MTLAATHVRSTTPIAALATALVATLALAPAPASAWGFTEPAALAPAGSAITLSADEVGNAAAAWVSNGQVLVSQRPFRSRTWTPAVAVSPASEAATDPDVSVGPGGDVAVVWSATPPGGTSDIDIAVLPAGGGWVAARNVTEAPTWVDAGAQVDVGPAGVATIVWSARNTTNPSTAVRTRTAGATSMSAQTTLATAEGTFSGVALARGAANDTVAAWRHADVGETTYSVQAARRPAGGAWGAAAAQAPMPSMADAPTAAMDGAGNAVIGWVAGSTPDGNVPFVAPWPRGGSLGSAAQLSTAPARQLLLAANASGAVAAAWRAGGAVMYADLGGGTVPLVGAGAVDLSLTLSDTGAATVAYSTTGGVGVAHRPAGGGWTSQSVPAAVGPQVSVEGHGADATLAWSDGGPVGARTLDNLAPTAVHLTAPMRPLNVGTRILAGWIGDDVWSPIRYEVQRQVATYRGGFGAPELWQSLTATDAAYAAAAGETVCLKVRGLDQAGNASPWSVARCATTPVNDRALKAKGWQRKKGKGYFSRDYVTARKHGATLVLPRVQARRLALLVGVGRGNGTVSVSLGKRKLGTYALAARDQAKQVVVPVATFGAARKGRLEVTVTSSGRPVRIDGVYAGR